MTCIFLETNIKGKWCSNPKCRAHPEENYWITPLCAICNLGEEEEAE